MVIARRLTALPAITPRTVAIALIAAVNVGMALFYLLAMIGPTASVGEDYEIQLVAGQRMLAGENPYGDHGAFSFRYSPFVAAAFAMAEPLGVWFWRALHFAVLFLLPLPLAVVLGLSWPFWMDVYHTNWMAFIAVFGYLALKRNPFGEVGFLAMALLIPRPLMLPLTLWIVWGRRAWWPWLLGVATAYVGAVAATGWGDEWLLKLVSARGETPVSAFMTGTFWLGPLWYAAAPVVVAVLMWRRNFGLASLAASPYWVIYYFVVLLWDIAPWLERRASSPQPQPGGEPTSASGQGASDGSSIPAVG